MMTDEQLRAKLIEDSGSAEEADRLLPVMRQLPAWSAPAPTAAETDRLVRRLTAALPPAKQRQSWSSAFWLLRAQLRIVQQEIWIASALVMTLGLFVTLAQQADASVEALPFVLIAPLVAALGIVFLYGPAAEPALEIELAAPVSPRLIVLTRLLLVFAFDLALGLIGSAALVVASGAWTLWPLVDMWLAPMAFLASLAFLLAMLTGDPLIGAGVCLFLRGAQVLRLFGPFRAWPDFLASEAQGWLWLLALIFVGAAVWLAGREARGLSIRW